MRYSIRVNYQIVSTSNARIKRLARLGERRHRDHEGVFVIEGAKMINRAIEAGLMPIEIYGDGTVELAELEMVTVAPSVLDRVSYRKRSEGLLAVFPQTETTLDSVELGDPAMVLVAEGIEKPGNLGAILRTADAVGAHAVITIPNRVDLFNPNVIRASTGACFTMPVVAVGLTDLGAWVADHGLSLVAADPEGQASIWDVDLTRPVALMVGAEAVGLTNQAREAADRLVSVPMNGAVDSLNASVTLALLAYEALRQRST